MPGPREKAIMKIEPLVIRDSDLRWEGWGAAFEATRGNVVWKTLFSQGKTPSEALTVGIARVPPGGRLAPHRHLQAEIYFVLEGEGVVQLACETYTVNPGTAIFIPGNAEHGISNPNASDVRFLYGFATDSFEDVIYVFDA